MSKIAHLHIGENKYDYDNKCFVPDDSRRANRMTLIGTLKGGSIDYILYKGWTSSGTGFALSNLSVDLPVYKSHPEQTKEEFVQELVDRINATNLYRVVRQVEKVTFE